MTIPQAFDLALQRHQAGRLAEAEALYRQILAAQPNHADALHHLGVIAHQAGRNDLAFEWIGQAINLNPNNPFAHFCLGEACRAMGRHEEAIAAYRRALDLKPNFPEVHVNLGNALRDLGRLDEAVAAYRRALELKPGLPEGHNNLGIALRDRGQLGEAVATYRRALVCKPDFPEACYNMGVALRDLGQLDGAVAAYRRALELKPNYPEAHNNLGAALAGQGRSDEAVAHYHRALELKPDYPEPCNNLGNALRERGQLDEAIAAYRRGLELKPGYAEAHNNLGAALAGRRQFDEAIAAYRRALEFNPDFPEAHNNLGAALAEQRRLDEAVAAFRHALTLKPEFPEAQNNLGSVLKDRGELDEAIAAFRCALHVRPEFAAAHSNLVYTLHFHPGHHDSTIDEERERWNRQFGDPLKLFIQPHRNDPSPERPLRIGYVSPDFREHVVGRNVIPLFQSHDRQNFEIMCYSGVRQPDTMTAEFRQNAQQWRSTVGVGDEALADMIRNDDVDILVDLSQHMAGNRLPMFARKPAPVQVSFAGYPESAGLDAIEYRISDRYLETVSAEEESGRKEQVCVIDSFWCYDPRGRDVDVNPLPALESGRVTFGCLGNFCKIGERVLRLWARVLGRVKHSRLLLLSRVGNHRDRAIEVLESQGIDGRRVEFLDYRPQREYLDLYHQLDIVLDTAPYNGHTTSLDALWMGTPVVSLAGDTPVSRAGLSQLSNLGLPELVTHSEENYVRIAVELAGDFPRLALLRSSLRARMQISVLMDAARFTRQVEQVYRKIWQAWCAGRSPVHRVI